MIAFPVARASVRAVVLVAAGLCVLALLAGALPGRAQAQEPGVVGAGLGQEVDADPEVLAARAELERQRAHAEAVAAALDAAAGAFERAHAHQLRLAEEAVVVDGAVDVTQERVVDAHEAFAIAVAESYKQPGADAALAGAVALAPDAATALHRAALVQRLTAAERLRARRAEVLLDRTARDARQHEVVRSGVEVAVVEAEGRAVALQEALATAQAQAEAAASDVARVEEAARTRIAEERRRAEAEARALAASLVGAGPLPPVDGKVCPIGAPNAFIDSWGFPRSGGRRHQGVDIFAAYGMPLYAVADGTITRVWNNRLGGLSVNLVDDRGDRYYYAHLSAVMVQPGQRVAAGQVIGANGNSGNARTTPPHLHWQYHPGDGPPVNPYPLARELCR